MEKHLIGKVFINLFGGYVNFYCIIFN